MCIYVNEITTVVNEFVNDNKMFTAFDVTRELRGRVKDRVQHHEVKREVHQMFTSGQVFGYNRTLANLPGVNPQPWIYHPLAADFTTYNGNPAAVTPVAPSPVLPSISSTDDDDDDDEDDNNRVYKFDSTDRLCVPNKLIRQLGLKCGDEVHIVCTTPPTNEVAIVKKNHSFPGVPPHISSVFADYVVDRYDNVRITKGAFNRIGLSGVAFEIEGDSDKIMVKKYA